MEPYVWELCALCTWTWWIWNLRLSAVFRTSEAVAAFPVNPKNYDFREMANNNVKSYQSELMRRKTSSICLELDSEFVDTLACVAERMYLDIMVILSHDAHLLLLHTTHTHAHMRHDWLSEIIFLGNGTRSFLSIRRTMRTKHKVRMIRRNIRTCSTCTCAIPDLECEEHAYGNLDT